MVVNVLFSKGFGLMVHIAILDNMALWHLVGWMKTTLVISDHLLLRAKDLARRRKTSLRSLTEAGLRHILDEEEGRERFSAEPVTFGGRGLQEEFRDASWKEIRNAAYGEP